MVKYIKVLIFLIGLFLYNFSYSQQSEIQKPSWSATLEYKFVPSISDQIKDGTFVPADEDAYKKLGREKRWHGNKVVPGKGLPNGDDPLLYLQENVVTKSSRDPILTFETTSNTATPSDPTGEIGRDYYVASWIHLSDFLILMELKLLHQQVYLHCSGMMNLVTLLPCTIAKQTGTSLPQWEALV